MWTRYWAYLSISDTAPVWLGAFGTSNNSIDIECSKPGSQGQWFSTLIGFLRQQPRIGWTYWAANSEIDSGLFGDNYEAAANALKQTALASIQFPMRAIASAPEIAAGARVSRQNEGKDGDGRLAAATAAAALLILILALPKPRRKARSGLTKLNKSEIEAGSSGSAKAEKLRATAIAARASVQGRRIFAESCTVRGAKVQLT
jgi:hypothetical protein